MRLKCICEPAVLAGFAVLARSSLNRSERCQIKSRRGGKLGRLPNYTCTETIQQSETPKMRSARLMMLKPSAWKWPMWTGRSYSVGRELLRSTNPNVGKMIDGSIGNGYFGLFSDNIFSTPATTVSNTTGTAELRRQTRSRYDYRVPKQPGLRHQN